MPDFHKLTATTPEPRVRRQLPHGIGPHRLNGEVPMNSPFRVSALREKLKQEAVLKAQQDAKRRSKVRDVLIISHEIKLSHEITLSHCVNFR